MAGAGRIARSAFGSHGGHCLEALSAALPGVWVGMVGWAKQEPARVVACLPGVAAEAVAATFSMARSLANRSTWVLLVPPEHMPAVRALVAERSETVGPMH